MRVIFLALMTCVVEVVLLDSTLKSFACQFSFCTQIYLCHVDRVAKVHLLNSVDIVFEADMSVSAPTY